MLVKSSGILLHHFRHGDSAVILKLFTLEEGIQTYYFRQSKKKRRAGILQPFSQLELLSWKEPAKDMLTVREIRVALPYVNIGRDIYRNTVILFLNEILIKAIRESQPQEDLFHFLSQWLIHFDREQFDPDAHIYFLAHLSAYLGFFPSGKWSENTPNFDLVAGHFTGNAAQHFKVLEGELAQLFSAIFEENVEHLPFSAGKRKMLLQALLEYLRVHLPDFGEIRSLPVLEELFRD